MDLSLLITAIRGSRRVFLCGNGGSAANAIHIANDLVACGVSAFPLTADVATVTAIANDFGYEHVFARQLLAHGEKGDLLIVLSGSGNSPNVLAALRAAEELGMDTWAIIGEQGGAASTLARGTILCGEDMQAAEEAQIEIGHGLMRALR